MYAIKQWVLFWVALLGIGLLTGHTQTPTVNLNNLLSGSPAPVGATLEWHSGLPVSAATQLTGPQVTAAVPGVYYAVYKDATGCYSQPAPVRVLTNTCPATTVDLSTVIDPATVPASGTVTFHSGVVASAANQLSSATVMAGAAQTTYYAAIRTFDASTNSYCYSQSSPIVVVQTSCGPIVLTNICPVTTVNLTTAISLGNSAPAGTVLSWHTGTPATTANKVSDPAAVTAGTYYAAFFDGQNNCYGSTTAPVTVSTTACAAIVLTNICPVTTVNLTTAISLGNSAPAGTVLSWHTGTPATTANKVSDPAAVTAGTYYAAFADPVNNCYSPASTGVLVSVTACVPCSPVDPGIALASRANSQVGQTASFSVLGVSAGATTTWAVFPSTGVTPNSGVGTNTGLITFGIAGDYQVVFTSSNSAQPAGCSIPSFATSSVRFLVDAPTALCTRPSASSVTVNPSNAAILTGGTASFSLAGGIPNTSVQWVVIPSAGVSPSAGTGTGTGSIQFANQGLYQVVFSIVNIGDGTCLPVQQASSVPVAVGLNPCSAPTSILVTSSVAGNQSGIGQTVTYNAIGGIPGIMTWQITPATGVSPSAGTGNVATVNYSQTGTYAISFKSVNSSLPLGCTQPISSATTLMHSVTAAAPIATPDIANTPINKPVSGNVLTNDSDPQGLPLTASLIGQPASGTVVMSPDGTYTYTPPTSFTGTTSFCYTVNNTAGLSSTACVTVNVIPVAGVANNPPVANNDATQTASGVPVTVAVLANDTDPDSVTSLNGQLNNPTLVSQPGVGTALVNANGTVTYTPPAGFTGVVSFPYQVCDKATPALCTTALVTVNVQPTPPVGTTLTPVAVDDALLTSVNTPRTGNVATNDSDPQGLPLSFSSGQPLSGTVVMSPTGSFTYTPAPGYSGPDSFTYSVCNSAGKCDVATVSVTVQPNQANQPPIVTPDVNTFIPGVPTAGNVLTNDKDPEGTPLTASVVGTPPTGFTMSPNGSYTYTPPVSQTATVVVPIQVCDGATPPACVTTTLTLEPILNPTPDNDAPVALDDASRTTAGVPVVIPVLANDKDPEGQPLSNPTIVSPPSAGTALVNANGTVTYTPPAGFTGVVSFPYQVCDTGSPVQCNTALVTVTVDPTPPASVTNLPPVALDDQLLTTMNTSATGTVAANDSDPNAGQTLLFSKLTNPANGTVVFNANGTYTYTPAAGYVGTDNFIYQVCDSGSPTLCTMATTYITVTAPAPGVVLLPHVWLQGAFFGVTLPTGLMRDDLRVRNLIPATSPYGSLSALTPVGPISNTAIVFGVTGNDAIVDWVFVELRSPANFSLVVDSRPGLVQRDGDIVDIDGVSSLRFNLASQGSYYVSVKHRNHLGVMTASAIPLSLTGTSVDFRTPATATYRTTTSAVNQAQVTVAQGVALWAGNVVYDKSVIYQGTTNDVSAIANQVKGPGNISGNPSYILNGYYTGDVNLDGRTIYQGTGNDVNYIYLNVTRNHPGNATVQNFFVIREQLP